ncbi:MAG: ATP-binding protein [archaeon]|nr:ATP-binding protein [archaeon]
MTQNEEIGTVISTIGAPSPSNLNFVVNSDKPVHRGMFVEMDYSEGTMIALVSNVVKTNRYFERADSVKEFETNGLKLTDQLPAGEWEFLVAETKPLGVFTSTLMKRPTYPVSPGTKVKIASKENLKKFLQFDEEKGIHLGELEYHDLSVKLNLTKLLQKHLAILALSGAGKSYLVSVLLEELLSRKKEHGRISCVVLDVHGEYTNFAMPVKDSKYKDYSHATRLLKARDIKIGVSALSSSLLASMMPSISSAQRRDLAKVMTKLKEEMRNGVGPFGLNEIRQQILVDKDIKENTKIALLGSIAGLDELNLFAKVDSFSLPDLVRPGIMTVIDLSDIIDLKSKQLIVKYFASRLFNERRQKLLPPFLLILEEAHQFIPEQSSREYALAKGIMETIAREGRKFGCSLCLISQRPIQLSTTVLSQCNTHIILRITNPYDLKHISESSEALDKRSEEMLTTLRVGEALIVGEAVSFPVFFKVRKRNSIESSHEISLEQAAIKFEEGKEEKEKETKNFL